ncbi:MAG: hypothetical protein GY811_00600 [Myxococcales bacterium]|nr:hypothetical protein [Myxococcales bacterium]
MSQTTASASPLELYGFGGRSSAMAGTGIGSCANFDCVYLNPAGLGRVRHKLVTGGFSYSNLDLEIDGKQSRAENSLATTFGLVVPLRLGGALRERLTLALGIFVPKQAVARARAPRLGEPTFALLDSRSEIIGIQVAFGYAFRRNWSFGAGVLALATLEGLIHVDVDGAGRFQSRSEQTLKAGYAPVFGARYEDPASPYRIGVSMRGESTAGYDIDITNDLSASLPLSLPLLQIIGTPQYDPAMVGAELVYQARPDLTISAQLEYKRWSSYLRPNKNPLPNGAALPTPGFHDTVVPRLGVEWQSHLGGTELSLRSGYAFLYSPAPEMKGPQSLLDNHRHLMAAGLGLAWPETKYPFRINLWAQYHELVGRTHHKDASLYEDPSDRPFTSVHGDGRILIGGFTLGVRL